MIIIYRLFKAEVKKQLFLKNWKYKELAKATGKKESTISAFMIGHRESENVANCIAKVLGIER